MSQDLWVRVGVGWGLLGGVGLWDVWGTGEGVWSM